MDTTRHRADELPMNVFFVKSTRAFDAKVSTNLERGGFTESITSVIAPLLSNIEDAKERLARATSRSASDSAEEPYSAEILELKIQNQGDPKTFWEVNPQEFKPNLIQVGIAGKQGPLTDVIDRITKTICDTVVSRKKTLGDKMDEEVNKNWRGCQGVINQYLPPDFDYQPLAKPYKFEDKGGGPWSAVMRNFWLRCGAGASPLPAVGQLIIPDKEMFVIAFHVQAATVGGVALENVETFLKGPGGKEFLEGNAVFIHLQPNDHLWVPWGVMALPLYYSANADNKDWAHIISIPMFVKEYALACGLTKNTLRAIVQYNKDYADHQQGSMWTTRATLLDMFLQEELGIKLE